MSSGLNKPSSNVGDCLAPIITDLETALTLLAAMGVDITALLAAIAAVQVDIGDPSSVGTDLDQILRAGYDSSGIVPDENGSVHEILKYIISTISHSDLELQSTGGTFTSDGNENIIYIENSPFGIFKARQLQIDFDNMVNAGDSQTIRVYYSIGPGEALKLAQSFTYTGVDGGLLNDKKLDKIDLWDVRYGMKITEQRVGLANDYDFVWLTTQEA